MKEFFTRIVEGLTPYTIPLLILAFGIAVVAIVLALILFAKLRTMNRRMAFFMRGAKGSSLEEELKRVLEDNQKMKIQLKNNVNEIVRINENLLSAYRKIGVVKYNAYPGMAGKVSSCVALLNNENNGIIVNSIHGQDGCYTYVREIMNGKSINPLTKEDEEALRIALQMQI